ncbi:hypothetical protein PC110_g9703 [Phytophthora cactorum]|uniref:Uncharacterized protein n=1 Tax=Phytophthora cactorum TaxID=29920 RepID=A0A329SD89_9STRA|nr:hypothetical protein PC114_g9730 [Phytophthora cactorum]RAW33966.1 hypothetical protein PC110_g9703 [Phytophthora cactorum]
MDRFLRERQAAPVVSRSSQPNHAGTQDVDMKSVGSPTHAEDAGEYDPDDLDFPTANRAAIAITAGGSGPSYVIQRVRISAMSDLKEFTGRDRMMSGARSWLSKRGTSIGNLVDRRETSGTICYGVSRLNIVGWGCQSRANTIMLVNGRTSRCWITYIALGARLKIKDGDQRARREHVERYIETLGDQELVDQLTLLRITDAGDLEEILRARNFAKTRQKRSAFGSKYRQRAAPSSPSASTKRAIRAIQAPQIRPSSGSEASSFFCFG